MEIFSLDMLADANHTINITVLTQSDNPAFLFDYFIVQATANSSISNPATSSLFIDDTSPYLVYNTPVNWTDLTPNWGILPQNVVMMNGSLTTAINPGASVSLQFIGMSKFLMYWIPVNKFRKQSNVSAVKALRSR